MRPALVISNKTHVFETSDMYDVFQDGQIISTSSPTTAGLVNHPHENM